MNKIYLQQVCIFVVHIDDYLIIKKAKATFPVIFKNKNWILRKFFSKENSFLKKSQDFFGLSS